MVKVEGKKHFRSIIHMEEHAKESTVVAGLFEMVYWGWLGGIDQVGSIIGVRRKSHFFDFSHQHTTREGYLQFCSYYMQEHVV